MAAGPSGGMRVCHILLLILSRVSQIGTLYSIFGGIGKNLECTILISQEINESRKHKSVAPRELGAGVSGFVGAGVSPMKAIWIFLFFCSMVFFQNCGSGFSSQRGVGSTQGSSASSDPSVSPTPQPVTGPAPLPNPVPAAKANYWSTMSTVNAPTSRFSFGAEWSGKEYFHWGGSLDVRCLTPVNTGSLFNPATNTWKTVSTVGAPTARCKPQIHWNGSKFLVYGGYAARDDGGLIPQNFLGAGLYDPSTDTWTSMSQVNAPTVPAGFGFWRVTWSGSKLIVWGGYYDVGQTRTYFRNGGVFDSTTNQWSLMSTAGAPSPRDGHVLIWTGAAALVWGGSPGPVQYVNDGALYNPETNSWTATSSVNADPRAYTHAMWNGTDLISWGGSGVRDGVATQDNVLTGQRYNLATNTWYKMNSNGSKPIGAGCPYSAKYLSTQFFIFGGDEGDCFSLRNPAGEYGANHFIGTGALYNPVTDSWIGISQIGMPYQEWGQFRAWMGEELFVWGGWNNLNMSAVNTGAIFNPKTNQWRAIPTENAPSAPSNSNGPPTATWIGNGVLVWTGQSGAIYYP